MTSYVLRKGDPAKTRTDAVVIGICSSAKGPVPAPGAEAVAAAYGRRFPAFLASIAAHGKAGEAIRVPAGDTIKAGSLVLVGLGERDALDLEKVRRAAGVAARQMTNVSSVTLALPAVDADHLRAVAEGFMAGSYHFDATTLRAKKPTLSEVVLLSDTARQQASIDAVRRAELQAAAMQMSRDWVNRPPNLLYPESFAEETVGHNRKHKSLGVTATVFDDAQLTEMGCGGLLGVGQASTRKPRLVKLEYRPENPVAHVALVGKGITYDSGGLTIKPGGSMTTMKCDMAGAAAVLAATWLIAELGLPVSITTFAPLAENMIAGNAMRPSDVLTIRNGKTVEVTNTDAEGRLVLADALSLAAEESPDAIVNIATLTGPAVVALGDRVAALFGSDETMSAIEAAAESTGELFWRLPVSEALRERVRSESKVADVLQHNWVRWGSASWAAAFLMEFTGSVPFAHLDTAGPSYNSGGPWGHVPTGGTGFGLPTIVQYVENLSTTKSGD